MRMIINADDFGMSENANNAIGVWPILQQLADTTRKERLQLLLRRG